MSSQAVGNEGVKEGLATIRGLGNNSVFYNPAQCVNRDLSVAMVQAYADTRREEWIKQVQDAKSKRQKREASKQPKSDASNNSTEPVDPEPVDQGPTTTTTTSAAATTPNEEFKGITIFEALAASGLRSIRYYSEIKGVRHVIANDLDPNAVLTIAANVKQNGLSEDQVRANQGDCNLEMHKMRGQGQLFDVIDLDPYGSAAPFLDAAVQSVAEGGLLCVTCTDMAVLCGNCPEVAFSKYGATPIRAGYMHEAAVRIVLQSIAQTAARYKRAITPLGSFFIDFYLRCFVRVHTSAVRVKNLGCQLSVVYQCVSCDSFALQPLQRITTSHRGAPKYAANHGPVVPQACEQCASKFSTGGPLWSDPMHDPAFLQQAMAIIAQRKDVMAQWKRISGLLTVACEELPDASLFYCIHDIASTVKQHAIPASNFRSGLINSGYRVSQSHTDPQAVKTNAPSHFVWDMVRYWHSIHPSPNNTNTNTTIATTTTNNNESNNSKKKLKNITASSGSSGGGPSKGDSNDSNANDNDDSDNNNNSGGKAKHKSPTVDSIAQKILSKPVTISVNFTFNEHTKPEGPAGHVPRFMNNPENWGPKKAAAGGKFVGNKRPRDDSRSFKSQQQQNPSTATSTSPELSVDDAVMQDVAQGSDGDHETSNV